MVLDAWSKVFWDDERNYDNNSMYSISNIYLKVDAIIRAWFGVQR